MSMESLIWQLTRGCANETCTQQQCATGRRNSSSSPVRDYTVRTARLIAFHILSSSSISEHRCVYFDTSQVLSNQLHSEAPRDPGSFEQQFSDALAITLAESGDNAAPTAFSTRIRTAGIELDALLLPPFELSIAGTATANTDFLPNKTAARELLASWLSINDSRLLENPMRGRYQLDERPFSLLRDYISKACHGVSKRSMLDQIANPMHGARNFGTFAFELAAEMKSKAPHELNDIMLINLLKRTLLNHLDGPRMYEVGHGALEFLAVICEIREGVDLVVYELPGPLEVHLLASTWLENFKEPGISHVLDYPFLFTDDTLHAVLRMVNHLRMRATYSESKLVHEIMDRTSDNQRVNITDQAELTYQEEVYLVLKVSRDDNRILQDTLDQLWQRRQKELLRPLRVHLGDLGTDIGGVQVEFLNIVCNMVLGTGMFKTTESSDFSWFRPGSLEPLHMFELLGILVALALHNGITIPVSFPLALYKILLRQPITKPSDIADGWPTDARNMEALVKGEFSLDEFAFSFEANGLILSIGYDGFDRLKAGRQAFVDGSRKHIPLIYSDISLDQHSTTVNDIGARIQWPGWTLEKAPQVPDSPIKRSVTTFAHDYTLWLTVWSVLPQLLAFRKGFHTLFPHHLLPFLRPETLKTAIEGTPHLDVHFLRTSTTYDNFTATDSYIEAFWSVVEKWSPALQMDLLRFVTAAERVPLTGRLVFKISRQLGQEGLGQDGALPTSSTCFCTLYLPVFETVEIMEGKLKTAVEFGGVGFGIA